MGVEPVSPEMWCGAQVLKEEIKMYERRVRDHIHTMEALEDAQCVWCICGAVPDPVQASVACSGLGNRTAMCALASCHLCIVFCRRKDSEMKMELARRLDSHLSETAALQDEIDQLKTQLHRLTTAAAAGGDGTRGCRPVELAHSTAPPPICCFVVYVLEPPTSL